MFEFAMAHPFYFTVLAIFAAVIWIAFIRSV